MGFFWYMYHVTLSASCLSNGFRIGEESRFPARDGSRVLNREDSLLCVWDVKAHCLRDTFTLWEMALIATAVLLCYIGLCSLLSPVWVRREYWFRYVGTNYLVPTSSLLPSPLITFAKLPTHNSLVHYGYIKDSWWVVCDIFLIICITLYHAVYFCML